MIQANELRIGNYVYDPINKENVKLVAIEQGNRPITLGSKGTSSFSGFDCLKPIELTEDILLKCGFKVLENQPRKWFKIKTKKRGISLEICFSSKRIVLNNGYDFIDLLYVKYLHQLQNLYFALTNQELTINL